MPSSGSRKTSSAAADRTMTAPGTFCCTSAALRRTVPEVRPLTERIMLNMYLQKSARFKPLHQGSRPTAA